MNLSIIKNALRIVIDFNLFRFLCQTFVIAFGFITIISSGGGDRDNKDFRISNLSPSSITVLTNRETIVTVEVDVENLPGLSWKQNMTISIFDSNDKLIKTISKRYEYPSDEDTGDYDSSGTIRTDMVFDGTIPIGAYTFQIQIYVPMDTTRKSNVLEGDLTVIEDESSI